MASIGWRMRVSGYVLAFALATALAPALVAASDGSRVVVRHLRAESLSHSLVGTDPVRELAVYLPPEYDESS
ncbi:MAG TPA: hypothetical protein VJS11_11345, partial [Acidobacteriaceae bacterium]|nr:hypothetical protein [Acidobacteriaceae bacterium]